MVTWCHSNSYTLQKWWTGIVSRCIWMFSSFSSIIILLPMIFGSGKEFYIDCKRWWCAIDIHPSLHCRVDYWKEFFLHSAYPNKMCKLLAFLVAVSLIVCRLKTTENPVGNESANLIFVSKTKNILHAFKYNLEIAVS
jgi:hypothetical protein